MRYETEADCEADSNCTLLQQPLPGYCRGTTSSGEECETNIIARWDSDMNMYMAFNSSNEPIVENEIERSFVYSCLTSGCNYTPSFRNRRYCESIYKNDCLEVNNNVDNIEELCTSTTGCSFIPGNNNLDCYLGNNGIIYDTINTVRTNVSLKMKIGISQGAR